MNNRDWEIFGREICRNVQDAIDSRDFSRLSQTINDTVYGAADEIKRSVKNTVNSQHHRYPPHGKYQYQQNGTDYDRASHYEQNPSGMNGQQYYTAQRPQKYNSAAGYNVQLYSSGALSVAGGVALTVVGGCMGFFSLVMTVVGLGISVLDADSLLNVVGVGMTVGLSVAGVFGVLFLISAILLAAGVKKIGKARRFRAYVKKLGYKEYGNIKELAQQINKPIKFVIKDIDNMIQKGWFKQGHFDAQKTCLITSHEAYQQYAELEEQRKKQAEQEKQAAHQAEVKRKAQEEASAKLSPQVREVIQAGEEYVRIIRECNDAIPGEEISDKIYKIEKVVDSIFDRVEKNPESVSDLHRMMEYYLPTTVKLLKAYESLDAEPVQGENILNSKREIEKTLDTLNTAFEKLLDSLFEDTAWDLSSDISVLNTMLAQEGLTEDQLKK